MEAQARTNNAIKNLRTYQVDSKRGFLPVKDPLRRLPAAYRAWEEIASDLPKLLVSYQVRPAVDRMPMLDPAGLGDSMKIERAMMLLSYIGHAYVWGEPTPARVLPKNLAIPWHALSVKLGRPPVLSYASYALYNWKRINADGPVDLGNIALLQNFLGGIDEEWFILIHVAIEAKASPILEGIAEAQRAMKARRAPAAIEALRKMAGGLKGIYAVLDRMPENCDPYIYYNRVRPYIHGWKNHPLLPEGVAYEGVTAYAGKPQQFRGETGAQSSIVPALDGILDVVHQDDPMRPYLLEMQDYMPSGHRAFIKATEQGPSIRTFVLEKMAKEPELKALYNECVDWVEKFRALHLQYAAQYILQQSQKSASNPNAVGTGGTPFYQYLKKHRDETGSHRIP